MRVFRVQSWPKVSAAAFAVLFLAGCATQRIDWSSRIGAYTYDQAVLELGPPDKQARLSDGTAVAEWLTQRGYFYGYAPMAYTYSPWWYGPYYGPYTESRSPDYFLRLTFGPDGRLQNWKYLYK